MKNNKSNNITNIMFNIYQNKKTAIAGSIIVILFILLIGYFMFSYFSNDVPSSQSNKQRKAQINNMIVEIDNYKKLSENCGTELQEIDTKIPEMENRLKQYTQLFSTLKDSLEKCRANGQSMCPPCPVSGTIDCKCPPIEKCYCPPIEICPKCEDCVKKTKIEDSQSVDDQSITYSTISTATDDQTSTESDNATSKNTTSDNDPSNDTSSNNASSNNTTLSNNSSGCPNCPNRCMDLSNYRNKLPPTLYANYYLRNIIITKKEGSIVDGGPTNTYLNLKSPAQMTNIFVNKDINGYHSPKYTIAIALFNDTYQYMKNISNENITISLEKTEPFSQAIVTFEKKNIDLNPGDFIGNKNPNRKYSPIIVVRNVTYTRNGINYNITDNLVLRDFRGNTFFNYEEKNNYVMFIDNFDFISGEKFSPFATTASYFGTDIKFPIFPVRKQEIFIPY
jgi:hypothetical protein